MSKNQKIFVASVISFIVLNVLNTYFVTTNLFNNYIVVFERTFLGEVNAILGNLAVLALILLIVFSSIKNQKRQLFTLMMATLILCLIVYGLGVYAKFYNIIFDLEGLDVLRNPAGGFGLSLLWQSLLDLLVEFRIISFVPFMIMFFLYMFYDNKQVVIRKSNPLLVLKRSIVGLILVLGMFIVNVSVFEFVLASRWQSNAARSTYVAQNIGSYSFVLYHLGGTSFQIDFSKNVSDEELLTHIEEYNTNQDFYINPLTGDTFSNRLMINQVADDIYIDPSLLNGQTDLTGILADKNLVLVHLESFVAYFYENFEEAFPFLSILLEESLVFNNFFHNVGVGTSADAEFSALTGLYTTGNSNLYWHYNLDPYHIESLPNLFNNNGFYTMAIQADNPRFYNREVIYPQLYNFSTFFTMSDFKRDFPNINTEYHHNNPWVTDFAMTRVVRQNLNNTSTPMFLFPKTMMPHTPFEHNPFIEEGRNYFSQYAWFDDLSTSAQKYLMFAPYIDQVIKSFFFNILTDENQTYTNSAFLFYGDHNPALSDKDISIIHEDTNMSPQAILKANLKTMAWLYVPGENINQNGINEGLIKGHQHLIRSQVDIFKTVVELWGIETDAKYFGVHMLSNELTSAINTRFFAVAVNKVNEKGEVVQIVFLRGNRKMHVGDINLIDDEFRKYISDKKIMINLWIETSMLNRNLH